MSTVKIDSQAARVPGKGGWRLERAGRSENQDPPRATS